MEGNLRLKIDWASHIVGSKFTVFTLFYFYLRAIFQVQAPRGLIFGGVTKRRVFPVIPVWGLIHGRAYFRNLRYMSMTLLASLLLSIQLKICL